MSIDNTKKIAIFASGSGSNALKIIEYFKNSDSVEIEIILSNKSDAKVLEKAISNNIETYVFNREHLYQSDNISLLLIEKKIDLIVLAGFLWLVPDHMIRSFDSKIINIHPALLPKYGGKGMYGHHVHQAVKDAKESTSGITIHWVNGAYDEGNIIFQEHCIIDQKDTPKIIAQKVLALEHAYFAPTIEKLLQT